MVRARLWQKH